MEDSNVVVVSANMNYYLYELKCMCFVLVATPNGRIPEGEYKDKIIALSNNGKNDYPTIERLKPPIPIQKGNRTLFRFEYA